jgi:hypothetical protein
MSNRKPNMRGIDELYLLNTVTEYNAITGVFQPVLISAAEGGPNGIIVNSVAPPELVVANQNVGQRFIGDIRVFQEGRGGTPEFILVPVSDLNAPAPPSLLFCMEASS